MHMATYFAELPAVVRCFQCRVGVQDRRHGAPAGVPSHRERRRIRGQRYPCCPGSHADSSPLHLPRVHPQPRAVCGAVLQAAVLLRCAPPAVRDANRAGWRPVARAAQSPARLHSRRGRSCSRCCLGAHLLPCVPWHPSSLASSKYWQSTQNPQQPENVWSCTWSNRITLFRCGLPNITGATVHAVCVRCCALVHCLGRCCQRDDCVCRRVADPSTCVLSECE